MTVPHEDSPMHQGQALQLPNPMDHFCKAAPLRHPLAQQPAAPTDQALSWLGLEGVPWASWPPDHHACGRNKCLNSHRNCYHNYQIPCD